MELWINGCGELMQHRDVKEKHLFTEEDVQTEDVGTTKRGLAKK